MKTHQKPYPQMEQNELKDSLKMILKSTREKSIHKIF